MENLARLVRVWKGKWKGRDQIWKEEDKHTRIGETGCKFRIRSCQWLNPTRRFVTHLT